MPWLGTLTIVGLVVLAILLWLFLRARSQDAISEILEKRRGTSKVLSRGTYVEGLEHIPVAMALTDTAFHYENADMQASFDLNRLDEVEYVDELATGHSADSGHRVLRLRSHGTTFEYLLPIADIPKWQAALPQRRIGQSAARVG